MMMIHNAWTVAAGNADDFEEQAAVLTALGCSDAQGYYFSRPADAKTTGAAILELAARIQPAMEMAVNTSAARAPVPRFSPFDPSFVRAVTVPDGIPLEKVAS